MSKVVYLYVTSVFNNDKIRFYYVMYLKCYFTLLVLELAGAQAYVYNYKALLLSGLHQECLDRAGIKIKSKVSISAVTENTFLLKVPEELNANTELCSVTDLIYN